MIVLYTVLFNVTPLDRDKSNYLYYYRLKKSFYIQSIVLDERGITI